MKNRQLHELFERRSRLTAATLINAISSEHGSDNAVVKAMQVFSASLYQQFEALVDDIENTLGVDLK